MIKCLFNPKDYTVTKTNNWKAEPKQGETAAKPSFTGGTPWEMNLQLLFDATLLKPAVSVNEITGKLFDAMNATAGQGRRHRRQGQHQAPADDHLPLRQFSFVGVAKNLTRPVHAVHARGRADPRRREARADAVGGRPVQGPEPDDAGRGRLQRAHVVRDGDSLASIATRPTATRRTGA